MTISHISDHPEFVDTMIVARQILRLGNAVKRDISRMLAYWKVEPTPKTHELIWNCRKRIFERLEKVSKIREQKKIDENWWNDILKWALTQVYKHTDSAEFQKKFHTLLMMDSYDNSKTGIYFLQTYMRIVARIPEDKINLPFHQ